MKRQANRMRERERERERERQRERERERLLIDCMVFNAVFKSQGYFYITAASALINAFLEFFNQYSAQYSFQVTGCCTT